MSGGLKGRALKMLARREHSRAELARKLADDATPEDLQAVLDQLERSGLLSDARFAESFVSSRAPRFGSAKLRHALRARGIADEIIAAALSAGAGSETARAREVWRRKFGASPTDRSASFTLSSSARPSAAACSKCSWSFRPSSFSCAPTSFQLDFVSVIADSSLFDLNPANTLGRPRTRVGGPGPVRLSP